MRTIHPSAAVEARAPTRRATSSHRHRGCPGTHSSACRGKLGCPPTPSWRARSERAIPATHCATLEPGPDYAIGSDLDFTKIVPSKSVVVSRSDGAVSRGPALPRLEESPSRQCARCRSDPRRPASAPRSLSLAWPSSPTRRRPRCCWSGRASETDDRASELALAGASFAPRAVALPGWVMSSAVLQRRESEGYMRPLMRGYGRPWESGGRDMSARGGLCACGRTDLE